jgi:hypothetical protein
MLINILPPGPCSHGRHLLYLWLPLCPAPFPADTRFSQIPKPNKEEGLGVGWPQQETNMEKLKALFEEIKPKV